MAAEQDTLAKVSEGIKGSAVALEAIKTILRRIPFLELNRKSQLAKSMKLGPNADKETTPLEQCKERKSTTFRD